MRVTRLLALIGMAAFTTGCPVTPVTPDPCADVTCDTGETCVDGQCVAEGGTGDSTAGKTVFDANCMVCHGADASGVIGPNIQGEGLADIELHVIDGNDGHLMFDLSEQQLLDVEAYLATLHQ